MSREDLAEYASDKARYQPDEIVRQLNLMTSGDGMGDEWAATIEELKNKMADFERYYQLVLQRDQIFSVNIMKRMESLAADKSVVVIGGFHREGILHHLKEAGLSYVVISPKVDIDQGSQTYVQVMLEEGTAVGTVFSGTFALETPHISLPAQRSQAALYQVLQALATELLDRDQINRHLRQIAPQTGILVEVSSANEEYSMVDMKAQAQFYDMDGQAKRVTLKAKYDRRSEEFEIELSGIANASEAQLTSAGIVKEEAASGVDLELPSLDVLQPSMAASAEREPTTRKDLLQAVVVDQVVLSSRLSLDEVAGLLPAMDSPEMAHDLRSELRDGAADLAQIGESLEAASKEDQLMEPLSRDIIDQEVLDSVMNRRLHLLHATQRRPAAAVMAVVLEGETSKQKTDELNQLIFTLMTHKGSVAHVYGEGVEALSQQLFKELGLDSSISARIRAVNVSKSEALKQIQQDLKGKMFNLYFEAGRPADTAATRVTFSDLKDHGLRLYLPPDMTNLAGIQQQGLSLVVLDSVAQQVSDSDKPSVRSAQMHFLAVAPANPAELDSDLKELFVREGDRWSINTQYLQMIRELFTAQRAMQLILQGA